MRAITMATAISLASILVRNLITTKATTIAMARMIIFSVDMFFKAKIIVNRKDEMDDGR